MSTGCLCCGQENGISRLYAVDMLDDGSVAVSVPVDLWSDADSIAVTGFCWCEQVR